MKILVTNDDGIDARGIRALVKWAKNIGDVTVIAPKVEQSAKSQSILLREMYEIKDSDVFSDIGVKSMAVSSTPADCVRFAVDRIGKFDVVFSGINNGLNLGFNIVYSGTCSAACEANYAGIPAVAFSTSPDNMEIAAESIDEIWNFITKGRLFDHCLMYNVNIPKNPRGIRITEQGGFYFKDHLVPVGGNMYMARSYVAYKMPDALREDVDIDAVHLGFISITPITLDKTDRRALKNILG